MVWGCLQTILRTSFGAPGAYLELSWSVFESSWGLFFLIFIHFGALGGGLGHRGILGDLYFQKWAPRLDGSTIFETCTSKNGKRVTEGAYSFAWDKERAGEGVREDETRSQRKNNNALPDSFQYESLEAREQDGITAGEHESMIP